MRPLDAGMPLTPDLFGRPAWVGLLHAAWVGLAAAALVALGFRLRPRLSHGARHAHP